MFKAIPPQVESKVNTKLCDAHFSGSFLGGGLNTSVLVLPHICKKARGLVQHDPGCVALQPNLVKARKKRCNSISRLGWGKYPIQTRLDILLGPPVSAQLIPAMSGFPGIFIHACYPVGRHSTWQQRGQTSKKKCRDGASIAKTDGTGSKRDAVRIRRWTRLEALGLWRGADGDLGIGIAQ
jgi:hypothetical protein